MDDILNDGNYPPGAMNDSSAPYNYDPEKVLVPCDNCEEYIKVADAKEWNDWIFCDNECLNRFLNE